MNLNNLTPDEWWNEYESMSKQEQYDFLKKYLKQGLSPDFAQDIGLVDISISLFEFFIRGKQYDKVLELQALLHEQDPEVLGKERFYADSFAVEVHLFKKDSESVKKSMESFIAAPVESIDTMIPIVDKLKYYGYEDFAQFLSKEVYYPIRKSDKLIGGAEEDFAKIILMMEFQNLYKSKREGSTTERKEFVRRLKLYNYDDENELGLTYNNVLTEDNDFSNLCYAGFNKDKKDFFQKLFVGFSKYVFDNKTINFPTAYDIWIGAWENFYLGNPMDQKSGRLDNFFKLNKKELYDYVSDRFDFLSNKKPYALAVLWGLQYVYDFLKLNLLVSDDNYFDALEFIKYTRMELIEGLRDSVWEYDFVHSWVKPDSISEEEFNKEKEYFEKTFYEKTDIKEYLPNEYFKRRASMQKEIRNRNTVRNEGIKIGRNDPCPCGSGKKYKKCCGK